MIHAALAILPVLSIGVYVSINNASRQLLSYPYGQPDPDNAAALRVAFSDPMITTASSKPAGPPPTPPSQARAPRRNATSL